MKSGPKITPVEIRLMRWTTKTDSCWLWNGAKRNSQGYGQIQVNGKPIPTHRLSYLLFKGPIPDGMCVCHFCDVTNCINPDHLWLGTIGENNTDRNRKGRSIGHPGESHWNAKLTEQDVSQLKELYSSGKYNQRWLADKFGVSKSHISRVVCGREWR